jgi:hypothetical protein
MNTTSETTGQATEVVAAAKQQVNEATEHGRGLVRSQVEARSTQVGEQAQSVAETLRQTAAQLRASGDEQKAPHARFADMGAERLDDVGRYLSESDADELLSKLEDGARRQPWLVAGVGLLLGIAGARFLKASSEQRYRRSQPADVWGTATWEPSARRPAEIGEARPIVPAGPTV